MEKIKITVNGEQKELAKGATIQDLLDEIGIQRERIAVEINREIVPRAQFNDRLLEGSDKLEIVTFVGGG